jgi:hypothetical protein
MWPKIIRICGALLLLPLLGGGTQCAFVATSGGHPSESEDEPRNGLVIIIDGQLVDGPVEGIGFQSGSLSGVTGPSGEFQFVEGGEVRFFIGDIALGGAVPGKVLMTPLDLVPAGDLDTPAVINMARLLQSLDAVPGDDRITIPASVHSLARRSNAEIAAAIDFLDFGDDTVFVNTASQLVATLTRDYGFTAALVDAGAARLHMQKTLSGIVTSP